MPAILSAIVFAIASDSSARAFAWIGAAGFIALGASVAVLLPLQRRIIVDAGAQRPDFEAMRVRWFRGHLARSVLSLASFDRRTVTDPAPVATSYGGHGHLELRGRLLGMGMVRDRCRPDHHDLMPNPLPYRRCHDHVRDRSNEPVAFGAR